MPGQTCKEEYLAVHKVSKLLHRSDRASDIKDNIESNNMQKLCISQTESRGSLGILSQRSSDSSHAQRALKCTDWTSSSIFKNQRFEQRNRKQRKLSSECRDKCDKELCKPYHFVQQAVLFCIEEIAPQTAKTVQFQDCKRRLVQARLPTMLRQTTCSRLAEIDVVYKLISLQKKRPKSFRKSSKKGKSAAIDV